MNKHTPGPWVWGAYCKGLYGPEGLEGLEKEILSHESYEGMWLSHNTSREANARLISAAPDLLEALKELLYARTDKAERSAIAAIFKATGEKV